MNQRIRFKFLAAFLYLGIFQILHAQVILTLKSDTRYIETSVSGRESADFGETFDPAPLFDTTSSGSYTAVEEFASQYSTIENNADGTVSIYGWGSSDIYWFIEDSGPFAQSDLTFTFTLSGPATYVFSSTVSGGSGRDMVNFDSVAFISGSGETNKMGALNAGTYTLSADCYSAVNPDPDGDSDTWSFELDLISGQKTANYTPQQIANLTALSEASAGGAALLAIVGAVAAYAGSAPIATAAGAGAGLCGVISWESHLLAHDPPDTNYTVIAQPDFRTIPLITPDSNVTASGANAFNNWLQDLDQAEGYLRVIDTCINRAQGAANDGQTSYETAQINAANTYGALLANYLNQEPGLRSNVVAQLNASGFPPIYIGLTNVQMLISNIANGNGLPANFVSAAAQLQIDTNALAYISSSFFGLDTKQMVGNFPNLLANTNIDNAMIGGASAFWFGSPVLLNPVALPNGSIAFDIPTLSSYTYTIQSSTNLSSSANWQTIATTNATSTLWHFVRAPLLNTSSIFFRVYHN